ncbi:MAG TPA: hypothetical protein VI389_02545 [Geobacteraceae bacterium]
MSVDEMRLKSNIRDYFVRFVPSPAFVTELMGLPNPLFIVDENVWASHGEGCLAPLKNADTIILPIAEERKSLATVGELYEQIMARSPKKNLNLISIGGGITQDVSGFVASTLYRGVAWTYVPTTLLAQTDSCIGAKTSLNFLRYKNLIGTFYPPVAIYVHAPFLVTQKDVDYFSGLGELVKLHLMGGVEDARQLELALPLLVSRDAVALLPAVRRALTIKKGYIEEDEFDTGRRNMLNYGHCFGHALETATDFAVPHGQAVVIGMILANMVAARRGLLAPATERHLARNVLRPIIRVDVNALQIDPEKIITAMGQDKKRTGAGLPLVMLVDGQGMIKADDLTPAEVRQALDDFWGSTTR